MKRRAFLKGGAGAAAAWFALSTAGRAPAQAQTAALPFEAPLKTTGFPFTGHPEADNC